MRLQQGLGDSLLFMVAFSLPFVWIFHPGNFRMLSRTIGVLIAIALDWWTIDHTFIAVAFSRTRTPHLISWCYFQMALVKTAMVLWLLILGL